MVHCGTSIKYWSHCDVKEIGTHLCTDLEHRKSMLSNFVNVTQMKIEGGICKGFEAFSNSLVWLFSFCERDVCCGNLRLETQRWSLDFLILALRQINVGHTLCTNCHGSHIKDIIDFVDFCWGRWCCKGVCLPNEIRYLESIARSLNI